MNVGMGAGAGLEVSLHQPGPIPLTAEFRCASGELLALVGPSGSGKSTVLRAIAGVYRPQCGHVAVNGARWFDGAAGLCLPPHRRAAGMVFQSYALFPHMNAQENIMAAMSHRAPGERAEKAAELLEMVHLGGLERRRPAELSGGQQQRVAVARALARDPQVLLLDEPFSAVDKATRQRLYREIAELRRSLAMPIVLVTHDLDEAIMLADRMAVLYRGRTLQTGTPLEVTTRPASAEVARLVDLRNLFAATVLGHEAARGFTVLDWNGRRLEAAHNPDFAPGTSVSWVVPDGFVVPHRRDRPSRGEHENPVAGTLETCLDVGPLTYLTLRPDDDATHPLHFSVPSHVARRNGFAPGAPVTVSLLAEGIHLMPAS